MNGKGFFRIFPEINIAAAGEFRREVIAALLLAGFSFLCFKFVYLRWTGDIAALDAQIRNTRGEIDRINTEITAAENLRKSLIEATQNLRRADERLKFIKERLPADKNISRLLAEISAGDSRQGFRILSIKPLPAEDSAEMIRLPFQLSLEAGFVNFGKYLERIENMERLMIVDNFMLESKEGSERVLSSQIYLSAYIMGLNR